MVKDRLDELKQQQSKSGKNNTTIEMDANEPKSDTESKNQKLRQTFEIAEVVGQWIVQLEKNNQDVRLYLKKVEEMNHEKTVEEKLQSIFQNNTSIAQQITAKLKEVDSDIVKSKTETTEGRIRNIQHNTLKTRFQKAFLDNNQLLENYKNIQKHLIKAQLQAKGYFQVTDEEVALLLEEGSDIHVFTENILAETAEAKRILASVEERHQQLLQIERMLTEVKDLFLQMAVLIESQQELVDRIEFQAQAATEYIEQGRVDLGNAGRSKKKYRKIKIYFFIAIIVLLVIILILLLK